MTGSPALWKFFSLSLVLTEPPAIRPLQFQPWLPPRFVLLGFCSGSRGYALPSPGGAGRGLPGDPTSLTDLRRLVDVFISLALCLLGRSSDLWLLTYWARNRACPHKFTDTLLCVLFFFFWKN